MTTTAQAGAQAPAAGPNRIRVDRIPGGAAVDVSHYLETVIRALVEEESPALDEIAEWAVDATPGSYSAARRDELIEALTLRLSPRLPVYGDGVTRLAAALTACAPERRAAA